MDEISSELNKLKIDRSQRGDFERRSGKGKWVFLLIVILLAGLGAAYVFLAKPKPVVVRTVRPQMELSADAAVLQATGYVVAHHKIQVGSKIAGRVAWIGVEKGDRVTANQPVVRLEDREFRAQFEQTRAAADSAQARLTELERGSRPEEVDRSRAEVQRAEAQLRVDESNFNRVQNLVREGVNSAQTLDDARGRFETSRAGDCGDRISGIRTAAAGATGSPPNVVRRCRRTD